MAVSISFSNSKLYVGKYSRPLADIVIIGSSGRLTITACLVDTGADYLQIPSSAASRVGLLPSSRSTSVRIRTAGGVRSMTKLSGVSIEIEGISLTADILCHPSGTSRALVGRSALKALNNVAFSKIEWLW